MKSLFQLHYHLSLSFMHIVVNFGLSGPIQTACPPPPPSEWHFKIVTHKSLMLTITYTQRGRWLSFILDCHFMALPLSFPPTLSLYFSDSVYFRFVSVFLQILLHCPFVSAIEKSWLLFQFCRGRAHNNWQLWKLILPRPFRAIHPEVLCLNLFAGFYLQLDAIKIAKCNLF